MLLMPYAIAVIHDHHTDEAPTTEESLLKRLFSI